MGENLVSSYGCWVGVAGGGADGRRPEASKVKVLTSPSAPDTGRCFPLNSKSIAPTLPALTTISFAARMVFSVGALKLLPCRTWCPSEVIDSQESP